MKKSRKGKAVEMVELEGVELNLPKVKKRSGKGQEEAIGSGCLLMKLCELLPKGVQRRRQSSNLEEAKEEIGTYSHSFWSRCLWWVWCCIDVGEAGAKVSSVYTVCRASRDAS